MAYFKIAIGLLLVLSLAANNYLYKTNAELEVRSEMLETRLDELEQEVKEAEASRLALSRENQDLNTKFLQASSKLDRYRNRESTVLAKKGLVQIKLNKSYAKTQKELSCMTGGECD